MGFPYPIVECAFNNASDETLYATQGWTEVTPWIISMSGSLRGRSNEVERTEAGTLNVTLDNAEGYFTPGNPNSPYYPNIKANRRFRVRSKNMVAPNIARGGGQDRSSVFFERPTWSTGATPYVQGVSDPVWKQHDPAAYPALPAELTDHIEVTVAAGTYSGYRRLVSWLVPVEVGVRLMHSAYIWKVSGDSEPAVENRFEIFYFDNDDVDIIGASGFSGLTRPMRRTLGTTPTTPTRRSFGHAPIGTAKYARVVWSVYYGDVGTVISAPITYAITGAQTELPDNLAPNPNGDWDALHWLARGGSELPTTFNGEIDNWIGFTWNTSVSLRQGIPHLIPGELYAVTAEVNLPADHSPVMLTGDGGATGGTIPLRTYDGTDDYGRTVAAGSWGTSSGGHVWSVTGTASRYSVSGSVGIHAHNTLNADANSYLSGLGTSVDWDVQVDFMLPVLPIGATSTEVNALVYMTNGDYYGVEATVLPSGQVNAQLRKNVSGVSSYFETATNVLTLAAGTWYRLKFQRINNLMRGSVRTTADTSTAWQVQDTEIILQGVAGYAAVRSKLNTGSTNTLPYSVQFDLFKAIKRTWVMARTWFAAGGPDTDVEVIPDTTTGSTANLTMLVRGLNVQRVFDPLTTLPAEVPLPTFATSWERPMDIFEGWVERWPWKVDENESTIVVVDRLKRVGAITLNNVVSETLTQDMPVMVIPMNDDPTNNDGTLTWYGEWAQETSSASLVLTSNKGDLLNASYTLGEEGPTEEPAILLTPASTNPDIGYYLPIPYTSDYATPAPPVVTEPPPSAPPPTTVTTYTKTYYATWSRSYDSDGTTRWDDTPYLYQGCYFCSNNQRALVGFNWSAITSDLSGASITSMYFTVTNAHARWNYGLTLGLGTHVYSSKPSTWSAGSVNESVWKIKVGEFEKKSISIPLATAAFFKSGALKGFAIGPAPSNITDNYGFFYGATQSAKPYITITYKK